MRRVSSALLAMIFWGCGVLIPPPPVPHEVLVSDPAVEAYATSLMRTILAVTPHAHLADRYQLHLARLDDWRSLAGAAGGGGLIYLDAGLARTAFEAPQSSAAMIFAMVLAHELAHEVAGHAARARLAAQYAKWQDRDAAQRARELEADRLAIGYWKALGFDCGVWVRRFEADVRAGRSDLHHPAEERLTQARSLCAA